MTSSFPFQVLMALPTRRERVLALASRLIADMEQIDLNELDGEFYWRICRNDLLDPLSQLAASIAPYMLGGGLHIDQFTREEQDGLAKLRSLLRDKGDLDDETIEQRINFEMEIIKVDNLKRAGSDFVHQLPRSVFDAFTQARRIPLRTPLEFIEFIGIVESEPVVEIGIYSGNCRGDDLECLIASYRSEFRVSSPPKHDSEVAVAINFNLINDPPQPDDKQHHLEAWPRDVPVILLSILHPLPPAGVVGHVYDEIVRKQRQWHLQLVGGGTIQDKEVAVRTWAVGLLKAEGLPYYDARREVENATNRIGVSEPRFQQDRKRLLERVPEAEPFLYVRGRRSLPLMNPESPPSPS